jgi:hypothetical protein
MFSVADLQQFVWRDYLNFILDLNSFWKYFIKELLCPLNFLQAEFQHIGDFT